MNPGPHIPNTVYLLKCPVIGPKAKLHVHVLIHWSHRRAEYTIGFWLGTYEKYRTLRMTTQVGFRSTLISHPVSRKHVMF